MIRYRAHRRAGSGGGRVFAHPQPGGFTLIELMIVVVIIGILASMAIPRFMAASARAKQSEAKAILKQIYVQEQAYRTFYDQYFLPPGPADKNNTDTFMPITVQLTLPARYSYTIISLDAGVSQFTATATAAAPGVDDDPSPDVWTINEKGILLVLTDDVEN